VVFLPGFFGLRECPYLFWLTGMALIDSEAAIIIGYPSPRDRGFYLAIWQTAKALGPIVGGAINLGLNAGRNEAGSVGWVL
jgi:sugar phosphate permease